MPDPDLERILGELLKKREELATLTWNDRSDAQEPAAASAEEIVARTDQEPEPTVSG